MKFLETNLWPVVSPFGRTAYIVAVRRSGSWVQDGKSARNLRDMSAYATIGLAQDAAIRRFGYAHEARGVDYHG